MKMRLFTTCCLSLIASLAFGEQATKKDPFWERLSQKLEKITPAKKGTTTTAVGGVRGAKNDEATDVYWKGKEKSVELSLEEMQSFSAAVDSRMKGDNQLALKQFEEFLALYPQSTFRVEGLQAVEKIRLELATAAAPVAGEGASPSVKTGPAPVAAPATEAPK